VTSSIILRRFNERRQTSDFYLARISVLFGFIAAIVALLPGIELHRSPRVFGHAVNKAVVITVLLLFLNGERGAHRRVSQLRPQKCFS